MPEPPTPGPPTPGLPSSAGALLLGTGAPLHAAFDVALLDLDGVVYVGAEPVPHAVDALAAARRAGLRLAFVTNNASRTPQQVAERLRRLGVPAEPDEVVTSAQAAAHVLAERLVPGTAVLVVGAGGLREAVRERGLVPVASADDAPAAVVQGYGPDVGWAQLAEAAYAVASGALWVATNDDATLPTPRGLAPGNGALVAAVRTATGEVPLVTGKPEVPMHREAVERSGARAPLVVGDRLDTDIAGAGRGGVPSLLVLTGVCRPADAVLAPAGARPDYVAADLRGLLMAHPAATGASGTGACRAWRACVDGGRLELERAPAGAGRGGVAEGDGLDPLRAACAAAWSAEAGAALDRVGVAGVLSRAGVRPTR